MPLLFGTAALLGMTALGVNDRGSLAGTVRTHGAAKATGMRLLASCRLDLEDGPSLSQSPGGSEITAHTNSMT